jgi:hypothetical protein
MYFYSLYMGFFKKALGKKLGKELDESILTDLIFDHCKDIYEYDGCTRCQFITLILLIVQARKTK